MTVSSIMISTVKHWEGRLRSRAHPTTSRPSTNSRKPQIRGLLKNGTLIAPLLWRGTIPQLALQVNRQQRHLTLESLRIRQHVDLAVLYYAAPVGRAGGTRGDSRFPKHCGAAPCPANCPLLRLEWANPQQET